MEQDQESLFDNQEPETRDQGPVECLGMTFLNDEERREYFGVISHVLVMVWREGLAE
jgi:hypothetical protein